MSTIVESMFRGGVIGGTVGALTGSVVGVVLGDAVSQAFGRVIGNFAKAIRHPHPQSVEQRVISSAKKILIPWALLACAVTGALQGGKIGAGLGGCSGGWQLMWDFFPKN